MPRIHNKKGFTLIELLVVISIIGLLATISMAALSGARLKARDARRLSDIRQLQTAIEMYYQDNGYYPQYTDVNPRCNTNSPGNSLSTLVDSGLMPEIPIDPINNSGSRPRLCYEYHGIGQVSSIFSSTWYCDGERRTDYQWALVFSLEGDNSGFSRLTNSVGTPINEFKYCIHGPLR